MATTTPKVDPISDPAPYDDLESESARLVIKPKLSFWQKCFLPYREAWRDLKSMRWQREGLIYLFTVWGFGLFILILWLILVSTGSIQFNESACHPDEQFNAIEGSFNWWAPTGLFQVTLRTGTLSFEAAKAVDVIWNLVFGRGGQALLALVSTRIWIECLSVSIATKPASFTTVWLLRFYTEPSSLSTIRLMRQFFFKRGLASTFQMWFIIIAGLLVVAFPTLMSSLAGYTSTNKAWVDLGDQGLDSFSKAFPVAFIIHDGKRVNLTDEYHIPYGQGSNGQLLSSDTYLPSSICKSDGSASYSTSSSSFVDGDVRFSSAGSEPCSDHVIVNVGKYVHTYGLTHGSTDNDNTTEWADAILKGPPLNISAFYLPNTVFKPNLDASPWSLTSNKGDKSLSGEKDLIRYSLSDGLYDLATIQKNGTCQPITNEYQWGFSFLQLFINAIILFIWTVGIVLIWIKSHLTLKQNGFSAIYSTWKGLLEFTEVIGTQLKTAGIDYLSLTDGQLQHEINKVLQGGSVTGLPLPQGYYGLWQGTCRNKWRLGVILMTLLAFSFDFLAYHASLNRAICTVNFVVRCITALLVATMAIVKLRVYIFVKGFLFLFVLGFFAPTFLFMVFWHLFPGTFIGTALALGAGTTTGSKRVLFAIPFVLNYAILFIFSFLMMPFTRTSLTDTQTYWTTDLF